MLRSAPGEGSPSERSSRRRERRYRSSSDSSEDVRAAASSPRSRRAHGGARTGGSTWDSGRSRSYARVDSSQSGKRVIARLVLREWLRMTVLRPSSR